MIEDIQINILLDLYYTKNSMRVLGKLPATKNC